MARRPRSIPEINAGSMADIAFLLLVFFLVTTTFDTPTGLKVTLPPYQEKIVENEVVERNVLMVLVNANDKLLVEKRLMNIEQLSEFAKTFITNNGRRPDMSDSPEDAIVSLKNDRGTSFERYTQVFNEIKRAYNEIKETEALQQYGVPFNNLSTKQQEEINKKYPVQISLAEPENVQGI